jgi:hypothetical protein
MYCKKEVKRKEDVVFMKMDTSMNYNIEQIIWPAEEMGKFDEYHQQYGNMPDKVIFQEIMKVKSEVSQELIQKHVHNLEALAQLQGFTNDTQKQRIDYVKSILNAPVRQRVAESDVESQLFFGGTSLLLWFLLLTSIWRRPLLGPIGRPGFGFPRFR